MPIYNSNRPAGANSSPNTMTKTLTLLFICAGGSLLADAGSALRETSAVKAKEAPVVQGAGPWLYLPAELTHVAAGKFWGEDAAKVSKATKPENADPLPAILDFKNQLDQAGIELILVPIPAKAFVYPEPLMGGEPADSAPERMDVFHQQFFEELRKNNVVVVDLLPDLLAQRSKDQMFCKTDTHWSGMATVLAAEKIAGLLKDKEWLKTAQSLETKSEVRALEIRGDLAKMQNEASPSAETLNLRSVTDSAGAAIPPDKNSPVVILGDSHALVFHTGGDMLASGAGLADQLAHELKVPIDLIGVRGSGATPARINLARRVRADEKYLKNKKVVVWCFTAREFTEATGWSKVPLMKP